MKLSKGKKALITVAAIIGLLMLPFLIANSYLGISGTVVDAETGKPIEGAVLAVSWLQTKGFGLSYTETAKMGETVTDREGKFRVPGIISLFAGPPRLTIYKRGYVAWNNHLIFPSNEKRTDFKWRNGNTYKLERFKSEYSHAKHMSFVRSGATTGDASNQEQFRGAIRWEERLGTEELDAEYMRRKSE